MISLAPTYPNLVVMSTLEIVAIFLVAIFIGIFIFSLIIGSINLNNKRKKAEEEYMNSLRDKELLEYLKYKKSAKLR